MVILRSKAKLNDKGLKGVFRWSWVDEDVRYSYIQFENLPRFLFMTICDDSNMSMLFDDIIALDVYFEEKNNVL